jgi:chromosome segregation ATPase
LWERLSIDSASAAVLRRTLGDIVLTTDSKTAASVAAKSGLSAVSLDGCFVSIQEKATISYPKCEPAGLVSTAPLQTRLEKREKELGQARKGLTELMSKIENVTAEREKVMDLLSQITRWSGTWERRKNLSDSIPKLEERIADIDDKLKELQKQLGAAESQLRKLDAVQPPERSRLVGQLSAVRTKIRRLQGELSKADASIRATEKDEETKRQELHQLEESTKMLTQRLTETRDELKQSKDAGSTILEEIDTMRSSREGTTKAQTSLKQRMGELRNTLRTLSERLTELNLTIKNGRLQVIQAKRQLSNMEHDTDDLTNSLSSTSRPAGVRPLEVGRAELVRVRHLLDDYQDVSESVAHTESKLKERMGQLAASITELKQELSEAESAVKSIRDQYQNGMKSTLSKVEEEIDRILGSVQFTGKVRFELSSNDGEYGVEFRSKIRGDSFERLSAGSGGERSLIAIGLILALQRFNPGPVYALDEIDTFLDATNTELVSRLLYDCSRKSQFILFTPAKSTHLLKHADRRIGVVSPNGVEPSVIIEGPSFSGE